MALVSKILESTLPIGSTSVVFTDSDIPNSLIRVFTNKSDVIPTSVNLSGTSITVSFESQTSLLYVALEITKSGLEVIDNLLSDSNSHALSANQGMILKGLIDGIVIPDVVNDLTSDSTTDALSAAQGKVLKGLIDAIVIPTVPEDINDLDDVNISSPINGQALVYNNGSWTNGTITAGSGFNYSENETEVGTWLDGSKIYQKTIVLTNEMIVQPATWTSLGVTITGISKIVYCEATADNGGSFAYYPLMGYYDSGNDVIKILSCRYNSTIYLKNITVRYLK